MRVPPKAGDPVESVSRGSAVSGWNSTWHGSYKLDLSADARRVGKREFALDPRGALLHSDQAKVPSLSVCGHIGVKSFLLSRTDRTATILIGLIRETFHLTKHGSVSSSGRDSPGLLDVYGRF